MTINKTTGPTGFAIGVAVVMLPFLTAASYLGGVPQPGVVGKNLHLPPVRSTPALRQGA
jgi:hypothetical protein